MHRVIEGLYVGGIPDVENESNLLDEHITMVVSLVDYMRGWTTNMKHIHIMFKGYLENQKWVEDLMEWITDGRRYGRVIVHCKTGRKESAAMAVAYLVHSGNFTLEQAIGYLKNSGIPINEPFIKNTVPKLIPEKFK